MSKNKDFYERRTDAFGNSGGSNKSLIKISAAFSDPLIKSDKRF